MAHGIGRVCPGKRACCTHWNQTISNGVEQSNRMEVPMTVALMILVCAAMLLLVPDHTLEKRNALRHAVANRRLVERERPRWSDFD